MEHQFKFSLSQKVSLDTGEAGRIIGAAKYAYSEDHYLIRYRRGDGCLTETWWGESALTEVPE